MPESVWKPRFSELYKAMQTSPETGMQAAYDLLNGRSVFGSARAAEVAKCALDEVLAEG